jgi:hypothetical protein
MNDMALTLLEKQDIVPLLERGGADCRAVLEKLRGFDVVTQEELVRACATTAVRE